MFDVIENVVFIQAKFHDIDENLDDQQIPWEPVLKALKDAGYTGYLSSEVRGRARTLALHRTGQAAALADAPDRRPHLKEHDMPNGLIHDDSLRAHPDGLALRLTIPWYRSLWLSSVTTFALTVDGEEVDAADLRVAFGDSSYALDELPEQSERLWFLQEHPLLVARRDQPVALGETHDVVLHGELRLPYMQIAPGQDGGPGLYVPTWCTT